MQQNNLGLFQWSISFVFRLNFTLGFKNENALHLQFILRLLTTLLLNKITNFWKEVY